MPRIAYIAPQYAPSAGGVERHVAEIAERAATQGYDVEVLTQTVDRDLPRAERIGGVQVHRFAAVNGSRAFGLPPALFVHVARHASHYDLIHAHSYHGVPALAATLARDARVVFTPHYHGTGHTPLARRLHRPYRPFGARIFARAELVICVSNAERRLVERDFPATGDRITVVPNGVDVAAIRGAAPATAGGTLLLSLGRLETYKRVDRALGALVHLPADHRLVVVGDGPAAPDLRATAAALGVADRVTFAGRVPDGDLRALLRRADVLLALSEEEAFGLTLLEGLAGGAAVVASAIDAHAEVLAGRSAGFLVRADDDGDALAATIGRAVAHGRVDGVGEIATWDDVADRHLALYGSLVAEGSWRR